MDTKPWTDTEAGTAMNPETPTPLERRISRIVEVPPLGPGFGGEGHLAAFVLDAEGFEAQDPFILLADDHLDLPPGRPVGGEHPHAGIEIATFVVKGGIDEGDEGLLNEGDVLWTTTGSGLLHGEHAVPVGPSRILQLWFTLPEADRWVAPHFDVVRRDDAPVRRHPGVEARVYSGSSGEARVTRRSHTPVTLVDLIFQAGGVFRQDLPASFNGFLYVLEGSVSAGGAALQVGHVGWLDRPADTSGPTVLEIAAGTSGARAVLYAGEPQGHAIVPHGPFVGGSRADLMRMSRDYLAGRFPRMSELTR